MKIDIGKTKDALIDIDRASEFTGDDVDQFSKLVDLEHEYENVLVVIPALNASAVVSIYSQLDGAIDTVPVQVQTLDDNATGHFAKATSSGAGSIVVTFDKINARYIRVKAAANQVADRTFQVRGC